MLSLDEDKVRRPERYGQRAAGEVVIPAQKRRHGRGFTPERVVVFPGTWRCNPLYDDPGDPGVPLVWQTPRGGEWRETRRRSKRPDGSRRGFAPVHEIPEGARPAVRADLESEEAAREIVQQALALGHLPGDPTMRVVPCQHSTAVRTIPHKGRILKWASAEDLVQAIACGVPLR